jgi:hypothetical protein
MSEPRAPGAAMKKQRSNTPDGNKPKGVKKIKSDKGHVMSSAQGSGVGDLQSVEEFRHFLLSNDSSFSNYISNPLLLSLFDSHLMRESMISIMA